MSDPAKSGGLFGPLFGDPDVEGLLTDRDLLRAMLSFEAALAMEARHQGEAAAHHDHVEGRTAFAGRRPPRWR